MNETDNTPTASPPPPSRWAAPGGYREVLRVALPLVVSTGAWSIQHFIDRMFITWYGRDAIAAALPAGILNFALASIFIGAAGYVSTFVAQYAGAKRPERVGPALWHGLYIALIGGALHLLLIPCAGALFRWVGHAPAVQVHEIAYFRMLCLGSWAAMAGTAMSGFFSGRNDTWPIMWVNLIAIAANLTGDYLLIFGKFGLPEMGIAGAGLATAAASWLQVVLYGLLIWRPAMERKYRTLRGWRPDRELLRRFVRFGGPAGLQLFIDIAGFTAFVLVLGRLGETALAATNIAFNINTLAFMPMFGFGMAVSVIVGRYLGADQPEHAARSAWSAFILATGYMTLIAAAYVLLPDLFLAPYAARADAAEFAAVRPTVVVLLRFVALYSLFDALNIIFASALRGAGDTRFVMGMVVCLSLGILVLPTYVALAHLGGGIYTAWIIITVYVIALGSGFLMRFLTGRWKTMRVIEAAPPPPIAAPESPIGEP